MKWVLPAYAFSAISLSSIVYFVYLFRNRKSTSRKPRMKLYVYPDYRSNRCIWLLYELGAKSDVEFVQIDPRETDTERILNYKEQVHPHGTIPALSVEENGSIIESGAICLYLADLYQKYVPKPQERREYYNWIVYCCSTLDEAMEHIFQQLLLSPDKQDHDVIQRNMQKFAVFAKHLNSVLQNRQYICGNEFTAADCILGYNLWWASVMKNGAMLKEYPGVLAYFNRLKCRPAFQQTFSS